jgi:hypothetical protein
VPAPVIADSVTSGRRLIAEAAAAMRVLCFTLLQSLRDSDFFPAPRYTPAHGSVRVPQETVMMQGPWGVNRGAEARPTVGTSVSPASFRTTDNAAPASALCAFASMLLAQNQAVETTTQR